MVGELASISHMVDNGRTVAPNTILQCRRIMSKLSSTQGPPSIIRRIDPLWAVVLDVVLSHTLGEDFDHLRQIANSAYHEAQKQKEVQTGRSAKSRAKYVEKEISTGAGAAHRLTKRDGLPISDFDTTGESDERSASP